MQRNPTIKRTLALLLSLVLLTALLPTAAFAESEMAEYMEAEVPTDVPAEPVDDSDSEPDISEETEQTEEAPVEDAPAYEPDTEPQPEETIESLIAYYGYAYVTMTQAAVVYGTPELADPIFNITQDGAVLLAIEFGTSSMKVCFLTEGSELLVGFVAADTLADTILWDEDVDAMARSMWAELTWTDFGEVYVFVLQGEYPGIAQEAPTAEVLPEEYVPEPISDTMIEPVPDPTEEPVEESANEPTAEPAETEAPADEPVPAPAVEATPEPEESTGSVETEASLPDIPSAKAGDYVAVTTNTRAFLGIDDIASDDYAGDLSLGVFVNDAVVQVSSIEQDSHGRYWFRVRYLYGDDFADGTLKWTEEGTLYVLASETHETAAQECSVTDYVFSSVPSPLFSLFATPMDGFTLKEISAPIASLYAGQTGVYGSSGRDSEYTQIASLPGHGTIYATPHYLDGFIVYCLEHNLPGPGENISGGGTQPTGPYVIVDIDSYRNNPGYSSIIYSDATLHAIAWVLRHTYPFMALDRSDSDNLTWTRVAGQFAIREVIKQMEGAQYVRSYWDMDNFYRASGQAPAVYLEYARWLAANGIARGRITGNITVSGKTTTVSGSVYTGAVTLSTDADLIRIPRSVGSMSGHTGGQDSSYYYLNSGDTITVSSTSNPFSIVAESVNSDAEEASFLVGVPSVSIQKVLIPTYGAPYKLKSVTVPFEIPYGSIAVIKKDASSGSVLPGAIFELLNSAGTVVQTKTTGADGIARFTELLPGSYTVREKTAPEGYYITMAATQNVTVTAGAVTNATFTNTVVTAKIRIIKKDQLTKEPLPGAEFTIIRLSAPASHNGAGVGQVVAILTTDANGICETDWLEWGRYRVDETKGPVHFVDNNFSTIIEAYENGKTYAFEVENEPAKGWIQLTKTDRQNGNPIAGVRFDIYYNDQYGEGYAGSMVTRAGGIAISEPLRKGTYIVKEHGETAGYVFEVITLDTTVRSDETTELAATNRHVTIRLKLYKRDAEEYDGENPNSTANARPTTTLPEPANISPPATRGDGVLPGAEFQVLAGEDITDRQGNVVYAKGSVVVASLKTSGEDVSVITDELWPGLYEIAELAPPLGYQASDMSIFVDARSAATQSQVAIVTYEGLKTNTILYGALTIAKFLGDNQEHTGAGIVETPEKGAEFEVYLKRAGSYEDARDVERDYLVTDRYGRATTKALPYGVYVLRQVVGQEGHALMLPLEFMIDGTEDLQNPPTLILNNQALRYRLRIVKTDAETGNTVALENTSFRLTDSEGNTIKQTVQYPVPVEIDTFLTDENGEVTLPETVAWGHYFIEEVQSPDGYLIRTEPMSVFIGHAGDPADEVNEIVVEFANEPVKGTIVVDKYGNQLTGFELLTDAYGNEYLRPVYEEKYLEGVVFEVRAAEDVVGKEGTVWYLEGELVDTIITTAAGSDRSKELPLGKYYLVEIEAPAGYVFESAPHGANLVFADNLTARVETKVEIGNEYLPAEISLEKEKEVTQVQQQGDDVRQVIINAPGEGFVFGLYNAADVQYSGGVLVADTLVGTGATDANGKLTISGYYPHGQYYFKELSAPKGWKLNPDRFAISLDPARKAGDADVIRASLPDAVHNELIYTRVTLTKTDITGENTLPGAVIEVKNSDGETIYRATTDENGNIPDIPVTPGTYTFHEALAPEGYAINEAVVTFTVDEAGNVTGDTIIRDDYTRFSLLKLGENREPLAGVEFTLAQEDGSLRMSALTDENGRATFEQVPYGSYTIVETGPLPGYLKNDTKVELTVDGYFINPSEPVATVVNQRLRVNGLKVDTSGQFIPGVEFSLMDAETGETVETVVSNDCGEFIFSNFDCGDWIIRETKVPEGYSQMEDIPLRVDESWTGPFSITCVNIPNHYAFLKIDHKDNPMAGARFNLEDGDGNVLGELVSDEDGMVRATGLTPGVYVIREVETLEGFMLTQETIQVVIDESYVPPEGKDIYHLINYPDNIQTGFEYAMTPVMWAGAALVLAAAALVVAHVVKCKKQQACRNRRKPARMK